MALCILLSTHFLLYHSPNVNIFPIQIIQTMLNNLSQPVKISPIHPSKSNKANFAIDWLCSNSTLNLSSWKLFKHQTNQTLRWAFEWFGGTWAQSNNWWKWNILIKVCRLKWPWLFIHSTIKKKDWIWIYDDWFW